MFSDSDIPSHKQNRASTGKLSVNTRCESHTPPTSHTESCSWCGPISFGSLSKGKHTLLITGGGGKTGGRRIPLMGSQNYLSESDKEKAVDNVCFHELQFN